MEVGQLLEITSKQGHFVGYLVKEDRDFILIKLKNGYNIGIPKKDIVEIKEREEKIKVGEFPKREFKGKGNLGFIYTGGTIGSKVDYITGGVSAIMDPKELLAIADLPYDIKVIEKPFSKFSEDLTPRDWIEITKAIYKVYKKGVDGVIVAHGTDTMHFSAAYAYYSLVDLNFPVAFVGAQRSSDRASTDAVTNLFAASVYAASNIAEVAIVMHEGLDDDKMIAIRGISARKMHSTRRDAFKSINEEPLVRIYYPSGKLEIINKKIKFREEGRETKLDLSLDERGALIYVYPGMKAEVIEYYIENNYRGIILAGTGMGHIGHYLFDAVKKAIKEGLFVGMTTQCIYGITHPFVYSTGRELFNIGVTYLQGTPEKNYVKLLYVLGKTNDVEEVKKLMKALP